MPSRAGELYVRHLKFMPAHQPQYWRYFQAIEKDLENCARFVEFSEANLTTYSNEFAKIILVAGAELDEVLRSICREIDPTSKPNNILAYRKSITTKHQYIGDISLTVNDTPLKIIPWEAWGQQSTPDWWTSGFNKLKHERSAHFRNASLEVALNIVGALYLAILHFHHQRIEPRRMRELGTTSKLFYPNPSPADTQCKYHFANNPYYALLDS